MHGYLVTFFTQQNRSYAGVPVARWLIEQARELGIGGATLFSGQEGFGHDGRFHSGDIFDLEDPPLQVAMALSSSENDTLMARIEAANIRIFYTKAQIEFGFTAQK
jgi:hypothetical protein